MAHLYELTEEYERLLDAEGEEAEQALMVVCQDIEKKSESICKFIAVLDADAAAYKAEEERLAARRKAIENKAKSVRDYIKENMVAHGIMKLEAGLFKVSVSKSSGKIVIDDAEKIPAKFKTIVQEVKIDNSGVKDALKAGESIDGAHIEEGWTLRIR